MTKKYLCVLVLTLPFGSPALASNQLASALDLEGSPLTSAQLGQVYAADLGDADMLQRKIITGEASVQDTISASPGRSQIAAMNGVDPMEMTLVELAALQLDVDAPLDDSATGDSRSKSQLALALGLDPQDYTLAELVEMKFDAE